MPKAGKSSNSTQRRVRLFRNGANDLFIAAHARSLGLTLVTENVREFRRVPRLEVENWVTPDSE